MMKKKLTFTFILTLSILFGAYAQRGRVQMAHGTLVSDLGSNLRGAIVSTDWNVGYNLPADAKQKILAMPNTYGLNTVHLYLEKHDTPTGANVRAADSLVAWTSQANMYLVITIGCGSNNGSFNLTQAKAFWNFYAGRYANNTHVIYEIHNEPIFSCNGNATGADDVAMMDMEAECYNIIRSKAPNTHVILYSNGGLSHTNQIQGVINGLLTRNVSFANASIAYHGYYWCVNARDGMGYDNNTEALALDPLIANGYSFISTEFDIDASLAGDETKNGKLLKFYEQRNTSWLSFYNIFSTDSYGLTSSFITGVENMPLTWNSDYGGWPTNATQVTITAQGENLPKEGISKLIDGDLNTKWFDYSPSSWVQFLYSGYKTWNKYEITSGNDVPDRDPKNWTIEGSNNGLNWVVLDIRNNENWASRNLTKSYTFNNSNTYKYYKWNISANQTGYIIQSSEFKFSNLPVDNTPPTTPTNLVATAITQTSITLNWTASTDAGGAITYEIWNAAAIIGTSSNTTFSLTGLNCNTSYAITVKAKDASNNVSASNILNVKTVSCVLNLATSGTASTWRNIPASTSTSNSTKVASTAINDGNLTTDVVLPDVTLAGNWQAIGIVWATAQPTVGGVKFFNGTQLNNGTDNGCFTANMKVQSSLNGTTWIDVAGWTITPSYPYNATASNQIYTLSGGNLTNIKGIRVIGKLKTNNTSWAVKVKELQVFSSSSNAVALAKDKPLLNTNKIEKDIKIYPNPASQFFNIDTKTDKAYITIFTSNGKTIRSFITNNPLAVVDCSGWASGIYLIKVKTAELEIVKKIIIIN